MITFTRLDLEFVLTQILQAQAGQPPVNPHLAFGLRGHRDRQQCGSGPERGGPVALGTSITN